MQLTEIAAHTIIACALLTVYLVLSLTGHDANSILALLAGQGLGVGVTHGVQTAKSAR